MTGWWTAAALVAWLAAPGLPVAAAADTGSAPPLAADSSRATPTEPTQAVSTQSTTEPEPSNPNPVEVHWRAGIGGEVFPRRAVQEFRLTSGATLTHHYRKWSRSYADAFVEALEAHRSGHVQSAIVRVRDAWTEVSGARLDVRVGYGRLVWGRLDEVAPTDVINPLDIARFLLVGRSEARLPVAFVRGRWAPRENLTIEGVAVPLFRRGLFDQLQESTSPFNLVADRVFPAAQSQPGAVTVEQIEPARRVRNLSGGVRTLGTIGRVDVSVSVFRGFDGFGPVSFEPVVLPLAASNAAGAATGGPATVSAPLSPAVVGRLVERHPRFTMIGGDMETVGGPWVWRAEVAAFPTRSFQGVTVPGLVAGRSLDVGGGFDRRAGAFRVYGSALVHREWSDTDPAVDRTNVNVVGSIDRPFGRERYLVRAFGVVNPGDRSGFLRGLLQWKIRDAVRLDVSAGTFLGTGDDTISRFTTRDFVLLRLAVER